MSHRARRPAALDGCVAGQRMSGMRTAGDPGSGIRCDQLVELVTDYLEGALDAAVAADFDAHLARCPGCGTYVEQMRQTVDQLGHVWLDGLSDDARARLLEAFGGMFG
jgi:hypothetical protein